MTTPENSGETERQLSARERLEEFLKDEPAGSPKILGLGDGAALRGAQSRHLIYERNSNIPQMQLAAAQIAVIQETIRSRQLSPNAAIYNVGYDQGAGLYETDSEAGAEKSILLVYMEETRQLPPGEYNDTIDEMRASEQLLEDLLAINAAKSQTTQAIVSRGM